jgi:hypothetical protein
MKYATQAEVSQKLSYTLIPLGFFEIISGILSGKLSDRFDVYKIATIGSILV